MEQKMYYSFIEKRTEDNGETVYVLQDCACRTVEMTEDELRQNLKSGAVEVYYLRTDENGSIVEYEPDPKKVMLAKCKVLGFHEEKVTSECGRECSVLTGTNMKVIIMPEEVKMLSVDLGTVGEHCSLVIMR